MKPIKILLLIIVAAASAQSCKEEKSLDRSNDLNGNWINTASSKDTLYIKDAIILRSDTITGETRHSYLFRLENDSIDIRYNGFYYIYTPEAKLKIQLSNKKDTLKIIGFSTYFPYYKGDVFRKL